LAFRNQIKQKLDELEKEKEMMSEKDQGAAVVTGDCIIIASAALLLL